MAKANKALSNYELAAFCGQMAMILKSGISSIEGITTMIDDSDSPEEKCILEAIFDGIRDTGSFAAGLRNADAFPEYMLNMTLIGEETGRLDDVMESLSTHYEREEQLNRAIKSTITYPLIMVGMMIVVIVVLLVKVMPLFNRVFTQLGTEMTGISKYLMDIGQAINNYSVALLVILVLVVIAAILAAKTKKGKQLVRSIGYKIRGIRMLYESEATCRFSGTMALALSSGLHQDRGLELAESLIDDKRFQAKLTASKELIADGEGMTDALRESGIFSGIYARMASVGQKSGSLEKSMEKIAGLCQEEMDDRTNNLLAVLEPTLVIILSLIIGIMLLSVMFPLLGIMSAL